MKLVALVAALLVACARGAAPPPASPASPAPAACPAPGAGKLEMRSYFLVVLHRGPAWTPEKTPETKQLLEGHMANIEAMARSGKLVLAGPTEPPEGSTIAGLFIFDVPSRADVEALIANDPAISAGRLAAEILPWYGPAKLSYPGQLEVLGTP